MKSSDSSRYSTYVLVVMVAMYTCNYLDRFVLTIMIRDIKADLEISDAMVGFLMGPAFAFFYTVAGLPIARWADKGSRRSIIALGMTLWSGFTALSGLVTSAGQLAVARVLVGVGEAAGAAPAHSLLSDYFPPHRRATALAIFQGGVYFGSMLGLVIGGLLVEPIGWRMTFLAVGLPGFLIALVVRFTVREPARGGLDGPLETAGDRSHAAASVPTPAAAPRATVRDVARHLMRKPSFWLVGLGAGIASFAGTGYGMWMPAFLERVHELPRAEIGVRFGLIQYVFAFFGSILNGRIADHFGARDARGYSWIGAISVVLMIPIMTARIAMARGQLDAAAKSFEEGIRLWPDNPDARYLAARVYERKGEWKQAAAHYREAARMDPPHYASSLALAELQRALGDMEGVSFLLLRLADKHPNDARVIEKLIEHAGDTGNAELGLRMMTHLSRLRGQAGHAVALAAERMELAEGPEAALAAIDKTGMNVMEPANVEALDARCRLLAKLGREDEAMTAIGRALEKQPDSARLRVVRAAVHREAGRTDEAIADLEEASRLDPESLSAVVDLASLQAERGHRDAARALYARAAALEAEQAKPDVPGALDSAVALARLEIEAGEVAAARERLREVLDTNPRQGDAAWLLLKTYGLEGGGGLDQREREDLALRAAVFEHSPEAQDYWKRLKPSES
ncbi:MAG: MFS transporter [Myxococcota bacterium]